MAREELKRMLHAMAGATLRSFDAETLPSRLRIQKTVYLFKALGATGAQAYSYNYYIHGPYSPSLAKDYYALKNVGDLSGATIKAPPPQRIEERAAIVIDAVRRGNDFLETTATVHWIVQRSQRATRAAVRETFKSLKPHLASRFEEAWAFLVQHRFPGVPT